MEAEFTILYGRSPQEGAERIKYPIQVQEQPSPNLQPFFEMEVSADSEFRAFVRRRILADIHQAFGRLRSHRRPHQQLKIYFIGDYPLDVAVTLRKASDITPEAATKTERLVNLMAACFKWMRERGIEITQTSSAKISQELDPNSKGYSQQYLSRYWKMLSSLIGSVLNEPSTNPVSPEELESARDSAEVLVSIANEPVPTLVECLHEVFYQWHIPRQWSFIWQVIPHEPQVKILRSLMLTLPAATYEN